MESMFEGTNSLSILDISDFNYVSLLNYLNMFKDTSFTSLNLGVFDRPETPEFSAQEIFTGSSNVETSESRNILSCATNDEDGDITNGYDIIINSVRYPCVHAPVSCELEISNGTTAVWSTTQTELGNNYFLTCLDGYESTQPGGIICGYDGEFIKTDSTKEISCVPKSCVDVTVANTNTSDPLDDVELSGVFEETQNVICDTSSGYVGGGEWTCALKGDGTGDVEWQGQACELAPCNFAVKNSEEAVVSIVHGETINVTCLPGFVGGGEYTCDLGVEAGAACTDVSTNYSSPAYDYIEENYHCDINQDSIEDPGEIIDFPDHSFVATFVVHENDGLALGADAEDDWKVSLPSIGEGLNYYIDWGDGRCEKITSSNPSHRYENSVRDNATLGTKNNFDGNFIDTYEYTVRVIGSLKNLKVILLMMKIKVTEIA